MKHDFNSELGALTDPAWRRPLMDLAGHTPQRLKAMLQRMMVIRRSEEVIGDMVIQGLARTPCHLGIGQEGVAVGVCHALRATDRVFGGHRSHGPFLALGGTVKSLLAEVLGKVDGCSHGMGGSMHLYGQEFGFYGSVPIVAGTISVAVGAALAASMERSEDRDVGVCFFGDGAAEEGSLHESLNLASHYRLPVLFVCENNLYSSHLDISLRQSSDRISRFAEAHGITAEVVDGNDVVAVAAAAGRLVARSRRGEGPGFLEAVTYRWRGHVGPDENIDVGVRRSLDALQAWKQLDPILRLAEAMRAAGQLDDAERQALQEGVEQLVEEARRFAADAPYPAGSALLDLVYKDGGAMRSA